MPIDAIDAVRLHGAAPAGPWLARGIVVGLDGSEAAFEALRCALRLGALAGCPVRAIAVWQAVPFGEWSTSPYQPAKDAAAVLTDAVHGVLGEDVPNWFTASPLQGTAADVLITASNDADLLIVGTRGRGKIKGLLLGSVSSSCVTNASCPVLVVNAPPQVQHDD